NEYRGAIATQHWPVDLYPRAESTRGLLWVTGRNTPAFVGQPKARSALKRATMRRRRLCRPTPCAQASPLVALARRYAEGPLLRLLWQALQACRRSGGTGSGGKPDKCGGKV